MPIYHHYKIEPFIIDPEQIWVGMFTLDEKQVASFYDKEWDKIFEWIKKQEREEASPSP